MRLPRYITAYGPRGLLLEWESRMHPAISRGVHAYAAALRDMPGVLDCVPAYASLLVTFDPAVHTSATLRERMYDLQPPENPRGTALLHRVPVVYGGSYGPDLEDVARYCGCDPAVVIERHQSAEYLVYLLGFRPGFAFLGETNAGIAVDRRAAPRTSVPAGSVGLAGRQTGIYPATSPGGWQLIGRTPWALLDRDAVPRFQAGDRVQFHAIPAGEFEHAQRTMSWPQR